MKKKLVKKEPKQKKFFLSQRMCRFCENKQLCINYKNIELIRKFVSEKGRILPRQISGVCAKHQRELAKAVKQARNIALLPG